MNPNESVIHKFYRAFQKKDYRTMIECYHPEIHFRDEVFDLRGKAAGAMWHMLCERGADLSLDYGAVKADDNNGSAHWEASYTFSVTNRKVLNKIDAQFEFRDGKIIVHRDRFDFWKWSRMALGTPGIFLGWSPMLRKKVSATANKGLQKFISDHPEYL